MALFPLREGIQGTACDFDPVFGYCLVHARLLKGTARLVTFVPHLCCWMKWPPATDGSRRGAPPAVTLFTRQKLKTGFSNREHLFILIKYMGHRVLKKG